MANRSVDGPQPRFVLTRGVTPLGLSFEVKNVRSHGPNCIIYFSVPYRPAFFIVFQTARI